MAAKLQIEACVTAAFKLFTFHGTYIIDIHGITVFCRSVHLYIGIFQSICHCIINIFISDFCDFLCQFQALIFPQSDQLIQIQISCKICQCRGRYIICRYLYTRQ